MSSASLFMRDDVPSGMLSTTYIPASGHICSSMRIHTVAYGHRYRSMTGRRRNASLFMRDDVHAGIFVRARRYSSMRTNVVACAHIYSRLRTHI